MNSNQTSTNSNNFSRRKFLHTASTSAAATLFGGITASAQDSSKPAKVIRWGFVGTGSIANAMARASKDAPHAKLVASSSRTLKKAESFAAKHKASKAFDSWQTMCKWDGIDAVYVATPTFVKEEITIAAAKAGKHVLCEKPLPDLAAVKRMLAACRENNVAFMDGTQFSHHPRSIELENNLDTLVGKRRNVHSIFQFNIRDNSNIRMSPKQEPMGAIGDAGWYNMRAIVEYIDPNVKLQGSSAFLRRDEETKAVIGATGVLNFDDGSTSTWSCAFDAGHSRNAAHIDGSIGSVEIPKFIQHDRDNSASYTLSAKGKKDSINKIEAPRPDSAILFENFAAQVHDPSLRKQWETKAERTQELLDAVWESAIANESSK